MDLAMPVLDGLEATRRLRADGRTATIPVIALTGSSGRYGERNARAAGCVEYLLKPCIPQVLAEVVRRVVDGGVSTAPGPTRPPAAGKAAGKKKTAAAAAKAGDGNGRESGGGALVLVVDDVPDNRELYEQFLEYRGFTVALASDGVQAIERARKLLPSIIVMDLSLPQLDGWETTRILKSDPRTKAIPVIALTGHALDESKDKAEEAGCDGYLTKPCLPEALVEEVQRFLRRPRAR